MSPPIFINTLYICDDRLDVAVLFVLERVPDRALNSALSRRSPGFSPLSFSVGFSVVSVGSRRMSRMNRPIAAGLAHTSKRGKRTLCIVEWGTELRAQSASDDNAARYYARFAVTRAVSLKIKKKKQKTKTKKKKENFLLAKSVPSLFYFLFSFRFSFRGDSESLVFGAIDLISS